MRGMGARSPRDSPLQASRGRRAAQAFGPVTGLCPSQPGQPHTPRSRPSRCRWSLENWAWVSLQPWHAACLGGGQPARKPGAALPVPCEAAEKRGACWCRVHGAMVQ